MKIFFCSLDSVCVLCICVHLDGALFTYTEKCRHQWFMSNVFPSFLSALFFETEFPNEYVSHHYYSAHCQNTVGNYLSTPPLLACLFDKHYNCRVPFLIPHFFHLNGK